MYFLFFLSTTVFVQKLILYKASNVDRNITKTSSTYWIKSYSTNEWEQHLNLTHIELLRSQAQNATRNEVVLKTLKVAAGVYNDKEKG